MKYVASCSFGKDSLAMIIKIKELGMPLDEVIYCDIRFDDALVGKHLKWQILYQKQKKY